MIYFTSDLHLNHDKDFIYKPRGYNNVDEMNRAIIETWNSIVPEDDAVFVLGDIMLGDNLKGIDLVQQLHGNIFVIPGNHDSPSRCKLYKNDGITVYDSPSIITSFMEWRKQQLYLCHYPTMLDRPTNGLPGPTLINLFGHTHQKEPFYNDNPNMIHVGWDTWGKPISIEEIKKLYEEKRSMVQKMQPVD